MPTPLRVLILEDQPTDAELMVRELRRAMFDPTWQRVEAESDYIAHLDPALDIILADYRLPQFDAMCALQCLQERGLDVPFIVVSGAISEEVAVECMRRGATDYLFKDRLTRLGPAVAQALEQRRLRRERQRAEETLRALYQASLQIQEPMGLQERLDRLLKTARDVLHVDRLNILLADPEGQWLQAVASLGVEEPLEALRVPIGPAGGALAEAYRTQQMIVWDGHAPLPEQLRLQPPYDRIAAFRSQVFANVPLVVQGRAIGVLGADRKHSRRPLDGATLELLQLFAAQAAVAIQNARLFEQIQTGRERLQALSRKLVAVQEAERHHLARELHDEIGQMLTGIKLTLEMSMRSSPDAIRTTLGEAQGQLNDLMARVRTLSLDLRPAMLDDLGLVPALLWHFERYTAQTSVRVDFRQAGLEGRLRPELETAVYRIVQEALTNVARHAGVNETMVILCGGQDILGVQVQDQGRGFNPATALGANTSSGLAGMSERAELLGGHLTVESAPGAGTSVTVKFPLTGRIDKRKKPR